MVNEINSSILLCHETLDGDVARPSKTRALQPLQSNKAPSSKKNNKASKKKTKKRSTKLSVKSLDDAIKEQDLCSCGKRNASKCSNQQCAVCCSGCPRHKKAKASKAKKQTEQDVKPKEPTVIQSTKSEEAVVEVVTSETVDTVNTIEAQDEEMPVVPIDIGGHHDMLGGMIRAILSFPNFCPE